MTISINLDHSKIKRLFLIKKRILNVSTFKKKEIMYIENYNLLNLNRKIIGIGPH